MQRFKIFALPYAAGSAGIYFNMAKYFNNMANIIPVELSGHGSRYIQPLCKTIQEMAEDVFYGIHDKLDDPYCLLGYSMGSLIGYELYSVISSAGLRKPEQMFLFAADAPHIPKRKKNFHLMTKEDIINELKDLNGSVDNALEDEELMEIIIPIARADFEALEVYKPTIMEAPITSSGFIMKGTNDAYCVGSMDEWGRYFLEGINIKEAKGDHFFLFKNEMEGYRAITKEIHKLSRRLGACPTII